VETVGRPGLASCAHAATTRYENSMTVMVFRK
jgi:hypothetical protein